MIKDNHIDKDSTAYYLPKDLYALLNPTNNVNNKIGFSTTYNHKFRNYFEYTLDLTMLNELGTVGDPIQYYTIGLNLLINDGLVKGISKIAIDFNQYFTSTPFNISNYNQNTVLGLQLGIKLLKKLSLNIYRRDVFYDNNFNGKIDLNSTMGIGLTSKF